MHGQEPPQHEDRSEAEARTAVALGKLAQLMGRLAARDRFAASNEHEDEENDRSEG